MGDFCYLTDLKHIESEEIDKMRGAQTIVISGLRKTEHISHLNLEQAIQLIQNLNPKQGYITHLSHMMGLHDEVSKELPKNIQLAYDGLSIVIN